MSWTFTDPHDIQRQLAESFSREVGNDQKPLDVFPTESGWIIRVAISAFDPQEVQMKITKDSLIIEGLKEDFSSKWCGVPMDLEGYNSVITVPIDAYRFKIESYYQKEFLYIEIK